MGSVLINTGFWDSDKTIELHLDSRMVFLYIVASPHRGYLDVFELKRHHASMCLGINKNMVDNAISQLVECGYIKIFGKYVQLVESYKKMGGGFNDTNARRELESLPVDVREYFGLDTEGVMEEKTKPKPVKKVGPKPETIKDILSHQPKELAIALNDLVEDRIERKKAPTTRAVKGWIKKLETMYPDQVDKRIASIEQTIEKGWMGLFEVKDNNRDPNNREFM